VKTVLSLPWWEMLAAFGSLAVAIFSFLLWDVNKKMESLVELRMNPRPVIIESAVSIRRRKRLSVRLYLFNPGDNPVYITSLFVVEWDLKDLLEETALLLAQPGQAEPLFVIPPREGRYLHETFVIKDVLEADKKVANGEGEWIRLGIWYVGGAKPGELVMDATLIEPPTYNLPG